MTNPSKTLCSLIDQYNKHENQNTREENSQRVRNIYTLAEQEKVKVKYLLNSTFTVRRVFQVMDLYRKMGYSREGDEEREANEFQERFKSCR